MPRFAAMVQDEEQPKARKPGRFARYVEEHTPTFGEQAQGFGYGMASGALGAVGGTVEALGLAVEGGAKLLGQDETPFSEGVQTAGKWISTRAEGLRPAKEEAATGLPARVGQAIGSGVGYAGQTLAGGALLRGGLLGLATVAPRTAATWAGLNIGVAGAAAQGYSDAVAETGDPELASWAYQQALEGGASEPDAALAYSQAMEESADQEMAFKAFLMNAPMGVTEVVPFIDGIAGVLARANRTTGGALGRELTKTMLEEGSQEALAQVYLNLGAHLVGYDEDRAIFEGAAEAGILGGIAGLVVGGGLEVAQRALAQQDAAERSEISPNSGQPAIPGAQEAILRPEDAAGAVRSMLVEQGRGDVQAQASPAKDGEELEVAASFERRGGQAVFVDQPKEGGPLRPAYYDRKTQTAVFVRGAPGEVRKRYRIHELGHHLALASRAAASEGGANYWQAMAQGLRELDPEGYAQQDADVRPLYEAEGVTGEALDEEVVSTYLEDRGAFVLEGERFEALARKPNLFRRVVDAFVRALNRIPGVNLTTEASRSLEALRALQKELAETPAEAGMDPARIPAMVATVRLAMDSIVGRPQPAPQPSTSRAGSRTGPDAYEVAPTQFDLPEDELEATALDMPAPSWARPEPSVRTGSRTSQGTVLGPSAPASAVSAPGARTTEAPVQGAPASPEAPAQPSTREQRVKAKKNAARKAAAAEALLRAAGKPADAARFAQEVMRASVPQRGETGRRAPPTRAQAAVEAYDAGAEGGFALDRRQLEAEVADLERQTKEQLELFRREQKTLPQSQWTVNARDARELADRLKAAKRALKKAEKEPGGGAFARARETLRPTLPAKIARGLTQAEKKGLRRDTIENIEAIFEKISVTKKELRALAEMGAVKRGWYSRAAEALRTLFGKDAPRFIGVLAATSPQQKVAQNLRMTFRVWDEWLRRGRPTSGDFSWLKPLVIMDGRMGGSEASLIAGRLEGELKVGSFNANMLDDLGPVTLDTWIAKAFQVAQAIFGNKSGYFAFTSMVRSVAKDLGWKPAEVQETIWSSFMALVNKLPGTTAAKALDALTVADVQRVPEFIDGLLADPVVVEIMQRNGMPLESVKRAQFHGGPEAAAAGVPAATKARIAQYAELERPKQKFTLAAAVGFGTGAPRNQTHADYLALPYEAQAAVTSEIAALAVDMAGKLAGAKKKLAIEIEGPGAWQLYAPEPSVVMKLAGSPNLAADVGAILGYLLEQSAVHIEHPSDQGDTVFVDITGPGLENYTTMQAFWKTLAEAAPGLATGYHPIEGGLRTMRPTGESKAQLKKFLAVARSTAHAHGLTLEAVADKAFTEQISNDWQKDPDGRAYLERLSRRFGPGVQAGLEDRRRRIDGALAASIARHRPVGATAATPAGAFAFWRKPRAGVPGGARADAVLGRGLPGRRRVDGGLVQADGSPGPLLTGELEVDATTWATRYAHEERVVPEPPQVGKPARTLEEVAQAAINSPYIERHQLLVVRNGVVVAHAVGTIGATNAAYVPSAAAVRDAFKAGRVLPGDIVVAAHNHPSGNPQPSSADLQSAPTLTKFVREATGIPELDVRHITVGNGQAVQFAGTSFEGGTYVSTPPAAWGERTNTRGTPIRSPGALRDVLGRMRTLPSTMALVGLDGQGYVAGVAGMTIPSLQPELTHEALLRMGAGSAILVVHGDVLQEVEIRSRLVREVVDVYGWNVEQRYGGGTNSGSMFDYLGKPPEKAAVPAGTFALSPEERARARASVQRNAAQARLEGEDTEVGNAPAPVRAKPTADPDERAMWRGIDAWRNEDNRLKRISQSEEEDRAERMLREQRQATESEIRTQLAAGSSGRILDPWAMLAAARLIQERMRDSFAATDKKVADAAYLDAVELGDALRANRARAAQTLGIFQDALRSPREELVETLQQPDSKQAARRRKAREDVKQATTQTERERLQKVADAFAQAEAAAARKVMDELRRKRLHPDQLSDAQLADPEVRAEIERIASTARSTAPSKLMEWRYAAMLSAPFTHKANIIGNGLWMSVGHVERVAEAAVNLVVRSPDAAQVGELAPYFASFFRSLGKAGSNFMRSLRTERDAWEMYLEETGKAQAPGIRLDVPWGGPAIGGRTGRAVRAPLRALKAEDSFFKTLVGLPEAQAQAYRIAKSEGKTGRALTLRMQELLDDPVHPMWAKVQEEVLKRTFQKPGNQQGDASDRVLAALLATRRAVPGASLVLPFLTTPYRIFQEAFGLAFAPGILAGKALSGKYVGNRAALAKDAARSLIAGALGLAILAMLNAEDDDGLPMITGTRSENRGEADLAYRTVPPYHIKILGKHRDYSRLEPLATILASLVDTARVAQTDPVRGLPAFFRSVYEQMGDKTFLQTIGDVQDALERPSGRAGVELARDTLITPMFPNVARQLARETDPYFRQEEVWPMDRSRTAAAVEGVRSLPYAVLPLASQAPAIRFDLWGRPAHRFDPNVSPLGRYVRRLVHPMPANDGTPEPHPIDLVISRFNERVDLGEVVYDETVGKHFAKTAPDTRTTVNGQEVFFSQTEYSRLQELAGKRASAILLDLLAKGRIRRENPDERDMQVIDQVINRARSEARSEILRARGLPVARLKTANKER